MTLVGGEGDDKLYATAFGAAPVSIVCGPGADQWLAYPLDTPGDGCAAHLAGITTKTVSRAFREGGDRAGERLGHAQAPRGPVRQRARDHRPRHLHRPAGPAAGVAQAHPGRDRWLRRTPRLPVFVTIRTRSGADRGETTFRSKVGRGAPAHPAPARAARRARHGRGGDRRARRHGARVPLRRRPGGRARPLRPQAHRRVPLHRDRAHRRGGLRGDQGGRALRGGGRVRGPRPRGGRRRPGQRGARAAPRHRPRPRRR